MRGDQVAHWREVEPLLFQQIDGEHVMAFRLDDRGRAAYLCTKWGESFPTACERLPSWREASLNRCALLVGTAVFLATLVFWPLWRTCAWAIRRFRGRATGAPQVNTCGRWLLPLTAALWTAFIIGVAAVIANKMMLATGVPWWGYVAFALGPLATLASLLLTWNVSQACVHRRWRMADRLVGVVLAAVSLVWIPWLWMWNLLGWWF